MSITTFTSSGNTHKITVNPPPQDGKSYPFVMFVHGNAGLGGQFGVEIKAFAKALAGKGYCTAVPQYFVDDAPHLLDTTPKEDVLADAIDAVKGLPGVNPGRLGLVGFSLGAATSMEYISAQPPNSVAFLADFFGFLTPAIRSGAALFPPTIIFHNQNDRIVDVDNSRELARIIPRGTDHELHEYNQRYREVNHDFEPGSAADRDSRVKTMEWCEKYLPLP